MSTVDFSRKNWLHETLDEAKRCLQRARGERELRTKEGKPPLDDNRIPSELPPQQYRVNVCRAHIKKQIVDLESRAAALKELVEECEHIDAQLQVEWDYQNWKGVPDV